MKSPSADFREAALNAKEARAAWGEAPLGIAGNDLSLPADSYPESNQVAAMPPFTAGIACWL
jgi:hypothetical protein